jgi:hypothetical protein
MGDREVNRTDHEAHILDDQIATLIVHRYRWDHQTIQYRKLVKRLVTKPVSRDRPPHNGGGTEDEHQRRPSSGLFSLGLTL